MSSEQHASGLIGTIEHDLVTTRPPEEEHEIHLPPSSVWPITLALGATTVVSALVLNWYFVVPGLFLFVVSLRGWIKELLHAPAH